MESHTNFFKLQSEYPDITIISGGGGGFGNPFERDYEHVMQDLEDGLISENRAESIYGVILDNSEINLSKSENLRIGKKTGERK